MCISHCPLPLCGQSIYTFNVPHNKELRLSHKKFTLHESSEYFIIVILKINNNMLKMYDKKFGFTKYKFCKQIIILQTQYTYGYYNENK